MKKKVRETEVLKVFHLGVHMSFLPIPLAHDFNY